jgi:hypothetical protein
MMDVVTTLNWFDKFFAVHQARCAITRLDVSKERESGETTMILTCRKRGWRVRWNIADPPHVVALLDERKQS